MQVAIPIPQPVGYVSTDEYKIQFSFDGECLEHYCGGAHMGSVGAPWPSSCCFHKEGRQASSYEALCAPSGDRYITTWLTIIGSQAHRPPYVEMDITRSGDMIVAVKAEVCGT